MSDCPHCGRPMSNPDAPDTVPGARATSRAAAAYEFPRSGITRRRILEHIARAELGATDEELIAALRLNPNTLRPRRGELVTGGWVQPSMVTRAAASGQQAIVWIATAEAHRRLGYPT